MSYNPLRGRKPQLDDFVNVLPVRSKKNLISVKRGYLTHCVGQNHTDKNPSMGLMQGDNNVIVKCFADKCSKEELLQYFYDRLEYYKFKPKGKIKYFKRRGVNE